MSLDPRRFLVVPCPTCKAPTDVPCPRRTHTTRQERALRIEAEVRAATERAADEAEQHLRLTLTDKEVTP
jgi:hypothetical protein